MRKSKFANNGKQKVKSLGKLSQAKQTELRENLPNKPERKMF
mgnify:CR=1 FL=1